MKASSLFPAMRAAQGFGASIFRGMHSAFFNEPLERFRFWNSATRGGLGAVMTTATKAAPRAKQIMDLVNMMNPWS